jgi:hypothetical protein
MLIWVDLFKHYRARMTLDIVKNVGHEYQPTNTGCKRFLPPLLIGRIGRRVIHFPKRLIKRSSQPKVMAGRNIVAFGKVSSTALSPTYWRSINYLMIVDLKSTPLSDKTIILKLSGCDPKFG